MSVALCWCIKLYVYLNISRRHTDNAVTVQRQAAIFPLGSSKKTIGITDDLKEAPPSLIRLVKRSPHRHPQYLKTLLGPRLAATRLALNADDL